MRGLYIHIPFCLSKCPYCDFYSLRYDSDTAKEYKAAVIRSLRYYNRIYKDKEKFDTVYFGGGTPILLWREICEILEAANIKAEAEITIEANPCSSNRENLSALYLSGINRISFGVQSLNDNLLKALGRRHNAQTALKALELASVCGFKNISADLMLGIPNQTTNDVLRDIEWLSALSLTHISAYMLKIEPKTPFSKIKPQLPGEDEISDIYLSAVEKLEKQGFKQYEISNFSKSGYECRHNLIYWSSDEYLGIGPSSHSFCDNKRFFVKHSLSRFISSSVQETFAEETCEFKPYEELLMLRLRLSSGLSLREYEQKGGSPESLIYNLKKIPDEYYRFDGERISLKPKGFLVSNAVISELISLSS